MWQVTTDNGNLVYKLEMNEGLGTLEARSEAHHYVKSAIK